MSAEEEDYVEEEIPADLHAQITAACSAFGVTPSELLQSGMRVADELAAGLGISKGELLQFLETPSMN